MGCSLRLGCSHAWVTMCMTLGWTGAITQTRCNTSITSKNVAHNCTQTVLWGDWRCVHRIWRYFICITRGLCIASTQAYNGYEATPNFLTHSFRDTSLTQCFPRTLVCKMRPSRAAEYICTCSSLPWALSEVLPLGSVRGPNTRFW